MPASIRQSNGDLAGTLAQMGGSIVKIVNDAMEAKMQEVMVEAKKRAPIEKGYLRDAIKLSKGNQRRSWTVYVDESMPDDTGAYTVGHYAMWLHEAAEGEIKYKRAGTGRKYLENPFREIINQGLIDSLKTLLQRELDGRAARRSSR